MEEHNNFTYVANLFFMVEKTIHVDEDTYSFNIKFFPIEVDF